MGQVTEFEQRQYGAARRTERATVFAARRVARREHFVDLGGEGRDAGLWLPDPPAEELGVTGDDPSVESRMAAGLRETLARDESRLAYDAYGSAGSGIFRNLAEVGSDEDDILAFAYRYGRLGLSNPLPKNLAYAPGFVSRTGEHVDSWRDAAQAMRLGVALWHATAKDRGVDSRQRVDAERLIGCEISVRRIGSAFVVDLPKLRREAWPSLGQERLMFSAHEGDWRRQLLALLVNEALSGGAVPSLVFGERGQFDFRIQVGGLLQFAWLQLAQSAAGSRKFLNCVHCGGFYEVGGGGSRADRKYCSRSCKQLAYRKDKAS